MVVRVMEERVVILMSTITTRFIKAQIILNGLLPVHLVQGILAQQITHSTITHG
jgi:hypothetical protein